MPNLGQHFLLDASWVGRPEQGSLAAIQAALMILPEWLGLSRVGEPHVAETEQGRIGMVLLAESHLSLHLRLDPPLLHADLFSCRAYDPDRAAAWLADHFGLATPRTRLIER